MKGKQPTRSELGEHIDELVDALMEIREANPAAAWEKAYVALQGHKAWIKRVF